MNLLIFKSRKIYLIAGIIALVILAACNSALLKSEKGIILNNLTEKKKVEILHNGKMFTSYIYPDNIAKPVLFPIKTLNGKVLTRGFPIDPRPYERIDHPHHVGLWLNYGNVNGLDFWNNPGKVSEENKARFGYIEHQDILKIKSGRKKGILEISALWKTYENKVLLSENSIFQFKVVGNTVLIDRITTLKAVNEDVSFKDNKEGMIGIRVARALELPSRTPVLLLDQNANVREEKVLNNNGVEGNYLSSEGITGTDVWGTRAKWMILSGISDCENVALAIIDHPENIGYPTYWHARDYGLFAANPLGQEAFSKGKEVLNFNLPKGESVVFRYRILVHSGSILTKEEVNKFTEQFSKIR